MKKILATLAIVLGFVTATQGAGFDLAGKKEGLIWSSLVPSSSPNLTASRANAMAGMAGATVPTDRVANPAAWYRVPEFGLKGFDPLVTSFGSWLGEVPGTFPNERGHRMVLHVAGTYPVSKYRMQVTSDTPMVTGGEFSVGRDSVTQAEIAFGPNFVGVAFGADGKMDSVVENGILVRKGDDVVYNGGQLPSTVTYNVWFRFGSTTVVNITDPSGFVAFKTLKFSLTAKLLRDEAVVVTAKVATEGSSLARLRIARTGTSNTLTVEGGSGNLYNLKSSALVTGPWSTHTANVTAGATVVVPTVNSKEFYRLERKPSAMLASAPAETVFEVVTTNGDDE